MSKKMRMAAVCMAWLLTVTLCMGNVCAAETGHTVVHFLNDKGWEKVGAYVYGDPGELFGTWPGQDVTMQADSDGRLWGTVTVPAQTFNLIIFNKDADGERAEVWITGKAEVYLTSDGGQYQSAAEAVGQGTAGGGDAGDDQETNPDLKDYEVGFDKAGAAQPYIVYEAEAAESNAEVLPKGFRYREDVQSEASGRQAVKLQSAGNYVEFTLKESADSFVLRYSMPDSGDGNGLDASLSVYVDGMEKQDIAVTSKYMWVYGGYPYTNKPEEGKGHRFYDETRFTFDETLPAGTKLKFQKDSGDTAEYYIIDFVEAEVRERAKAQPANSLSIVEYGATPNDGTDDYQAITVCIAAAKAQGKEVWIPEGTFTLEQKRAIEINDVVIRGAGMWYSVLSGAGAAFNYSGTSRCYDFAMTGVSTVRDDGGDLAGFEGKGEAVNVTIQNIWMEHMKVGVWSYNTKNLVIQGCRIRNTYADGINLSSGTNGAVIRNNSVRNTGDDGIAIWPWQKDSCNNLITHNTVQVPTLANAIAVYGGSGNAVTGNYAADIVNNGSGICIGTDYDTANGFSGVTTVKDNTLVRCGSYHTDYDYPVGAVWFWATKTPMEAEYLVENMNLQDCSYEAFLFDCYRNIRGVNVKNVTVTGGVTDGILIKGTAEGSMTYQNVKIDAYDQFINNQLGNDKFAVTELEVEDTEAPTTQAETEAAAPGTTEVSTEIKTEAGTEQKPEEGNSETSTEASTEDRTEQKPDDGSSETPTEATTEDRTEQKPDDGSSETPTEATTEGRTEQKPDDGSSETPTEATTEDRTEQKPDDGSSETPTEATTEGRTEQKPEGGSSETPTEASTEGRTEQKPEGGNSETPTEATTENRTEQKPDDGRSETPTEMPAGGTAQNPDGGTGVITTETGGMNAVLPKVGKKFYDAKTKATFEVTHSGIVQNGIVIGAEAAFAAADKSKSSVVIPDTVSDGTTTYKVTSIKANAMKNNKKLKKVRIGKHVTKIGKAAFSGCRNLKSITIQSKKLTGVGKKALNGIHKKAVIKVPKSRLAAYKKLFKPGTGYKKSMNVKK